jgi:choice-of-anchor A domain-containing protein
LGSSCEDYDAIKYLNEYNLITLSDLSTNSDVEFKTLVCGKLTSGSSANFGIHTDQLNLNALTPVLELAQSVTSGSPLNVQRGSVSLGQSIDAIVKNGNVPYVVNGNRPFNINGGNDGAKISYDSKLVEKCQDISQDLKELSLLLSKRTPNNVVTVPSDQPGPLNVKVVSKDDNGFAFFTVSNGDSVFHNSKVQQIEIINSVQATTIVINVPGKSVTFDSGNIVGQLTQSDLRSRVLFNFFEAEQINLNRNFMGALLAPLATVQANANIDGATAVKSLTTTSELHKPQFLIPQCVGTASGPKTSKY